MEHLLGALPAAWFRDAWRLGRADLTHSHRLETSAYVVPLLLGQVEERLRRVLLPDDFVPLSEMDLVKQELDAVAEICGLSAEQKQRWKDVTDRLNIARGEQPFLISLDGLQVDCEQVFGTLLDGLATRYVEVLRKIDRFPQKPSPEALRRLLVKLPDNVLVHDRLLAKLPRESRYLEALKNAGFFRAPPPPELDAQGNILPSRPWRAAEFLAQVSHDPTLHDAVWAIMEGLPDTDNESVHRSLAKAAMELPVQLAAQWACREVAWLEAGAVRNRTYAYDHPLEQLGALAANLAQRGAVTESLSLFRALLKYPPSVRSTDGSVSGSPNTLPAEHSAAHVLRTHLPSLIQHAGVSLMPVLDMLSDVIDSIEEWHAGSDDGACTYLSLERTAIAPQKEPTSLFGSVLYDLLIDQTVAVAEKAAQTDSLLATVERLEQRRSVLLHRMALYLLSRFPEQADILIRARLVEAKQYQERRLDPEYKDLLGTHFRLLPRADQQTILGWISNGPPEFYFAEMRARWGVFESESYVRSWTYRRLQELEPSLSALPDSWQKRYEDLRKEFVSQTPERARVYTADDLLNMDVGAALRLVSTELSPSNDFEQEQQNKTSLRSLQEAISREPSRFAERPGGFLQQPEQHQEALIAGLSEALRSGKRFSISKVLLWLRDLLTTKHTEKATSGEDTSWGGLRNTTARFVKQTLQGQEQPVASMADFPVIFDILRELLLTPSRMSVTPQTAEPRERGPNNWEQELLNTTRGMAFMALITAAWWVWRDRKSRGQDKLSLREIDGVEGILRLLLDAQAPLFHAGFGERLWTLVNIDANWVTEQLKNIFPTAAEQSKLFEAAWQTYLTYGGYYPDEAWFPLLRFAYEHALDQLKGVVADPKRADSATGSAARLGSHLIRLYLGELLDLQNGSLLSRFFDHAPDASCRLALSPIVAYVGQLHGGSRESTDVELSRLLALWSFRRPKLLAAKVERKSEAAAFVELSTSARLSSEQSLQILEQLLPFADIARWSHRMLKRLAALADERPAACLRCLTIFFNRNGFPHEEETKAILRAALASADADLQQEARDWANRLVASGYVSFESILPVPAPLPTVEVVGPIKSASEPTVSTTAQPQMLLDRLVVEGFKSLHSLNLELGTFNVFVGANGSGKTNILEALGVLGAATFKEVTPETLMERNVRPARALLYKSAFQAHDLRRLITLTAHGANGVLYQLGLDPADEGGTRWRIFSERLDDKERKILRRNARSCLIFDAEGKSQRIAEPVPTETYASSAASLNPDAKSVRAMMDLLKGFCVFSPSTQVLRGLAEDRARAPLGLGGGGLPRALRELLLPKERRLGAFDIDEILELIGWADGLSVIPSSEAKLSPAIHPQQLVVEFRDRFMKRGRNLLTDYDASEGALYVLFYLALASHAEAPRLCAIDNFDQCIHPRLASRLTQLLSEQLVRDGSRQWLLTTHSPLVLDGLDLRNDRIRLFAVDRTDSGVTQVRRIQVKPELLTDLSKGYSLSRLWLMGRLGGVPEL